MNSPNLASGKIYIFTSLQNVGKRIERKKNKTPKICIIELGYVRLPLKTVNLLLDNQSPLIDVSVDKIFNLRRSKVVIDCKNIFKDLSDIIYLGMEKGEIKKRRREDDKE